MNNTQNLVQVSQINFKFAKLATVVVLLASYLAT